MNFFSDITLFVHAFGKTKREMIASVKLLAILTVVFSVLLFLAERRSNPDYSYTDALTWTFVKYVDDPADIASPPQTGLGMIIGTLVGVLGIAIFAVPAGLIGSGFIDLMAERKRQKQLSEYHRKLKQQFSMNNGRALKAYLAKLPQDPDAWYSGCSFSYLANNYAVSKFQLKGMELQDVLDVCQTYREFRVKNEASAKSIEEDRRDRYVLEHFPVNRRYGYYVNRGSKVTIISTSSSSELCTGNFSYYLAKFAGFNYISKDFNVADGESYYNNHWEEPRYEGFTLQERIDRGEKITPAMRRIYKEKLQLREEFLADVKSLCHDEDSWVVCLLMQLQNQDNKVDVHVAHSLSDGSASTIRHHQEQYAALLNALTSNLQEELQLTVEETTRYPLIRRGSYRNLLYKLHDDGCRCNGLTLRLSSHLMAFDTRARVAQFIMARSIHDVIEPDHRLLPNEVEDMNRTSRFRGFADQEIDKWRTKLFDEE